MDRALHNPWRPFLLLFAWLALIAVSVPRLTLGLRLLRQGARVEGVVLQVTPSGYVVRTDNGTVHVGKRGTLGELLMGARHRRGERIEFFVDRSSPDTAREIRFPPGLVVLFALASLGVVSVAGGAMVQRRLAQ